MKQLFLSILGFLGVIGKTFKNVVENIFVEVK